MNIYYFNMNVNLKSRTNLVSVSGQNDSLNYFGIDLEFGNVIIISGSDSMIVSDPADNLRCVYGDVCIVGLGNLLIS